jgi:hypothetical protein
MAESRSHFRAFRCASTCSSISFCKRDDTLRLSSAASFSNAFFKAGLRRTATCGEFAIAKIATVTVSDTDGYCVACFSEGSKDKKGGGNAKQQTLRSAEQTRKKSRPSHFNWKEAKTMTETTIVNFRNFGSTVRRMKGSDDKWYLCFVVWYRNGRKSLGYFYPSLKWF